MHTKFPVLDNFQIPCAFSDMEFFPHFPCFPRTFLIFFIQAYWSSTHELLDHFGAPSVQGVIPTSIYVPATDRVRTHAGVI